MLHDSRLLCDTDMFWTGTHCASCNFTCTYKRSDHCKTTCPYFEKAPLESDSCTEICVCNTILSLVLMIIIILCCILLYNKKLYLRLRKYISRKCKRGGGSDTNRTEEQLNSNNANEEDDGAETSADQSLVRAPLVSGNRNET
ncbi:uncharacterized protein LOC132746485 [Ruditapes philippinarum]|uniref:uncharacterized protein LOC132746485 n=1 Tax=Ruditapes philippinarum TaxID=129788 RepID=UPI00295A6A54|nr:uncharacterized protein LOC132746485 [Ruditapes philippinarum]